MTVIPFYGAERPDLFAIERKAQDRPGLLIQALRERLRAEDWSPISGQGTAIRLDSCRRLSERLCPLSRRRA